MGSATDASAISHLFLVYFYALKAATECQALLGFMIVGQRIYRPRPRVIAD